MSFDAAKIPYNIELMKNTLNAIEKIPYWCYDPDMNLLRTNSGRMFSDKILRQKNILEQILPAFSKDQSPVILSADYSLFWGFVCETDSHGTPILFHVLGPILGEELSEQYTASQMRKHSVPLEQRKNFSDFLHETVILPPMKLFTYLLMLHYCASGQTLTSGDIRFLRPVYNQSSNAGTAFGDTSFSSSQNSATDKSTEASKDTAAPISSDALFNNDRRRTYMAEQALLQMIRDGNIHYQKALDAASSLSSGVRIHTKESITQARISAITFTTLAVRAAIEGGLTPEIAYSRGDAYLQSISSCNNYAELVSINHQMYEDFIRCVHNQKNAPALSPAIRTCCDYIHTHLEENLSLSGLARRVGYTEYYLSRKFASETGVSIGDYIKGSPNRTGKTVLSRYGYGHYRYQRKALLQLQKLLLKGFPGKDWHHSGSLPSLTPEIATHPKSSCHLSTLSTTGPIRPEGSIGMDLENQSLS